ncbi:MAG: PSD1 domain-containing protein [Planctomycetaceae bacterium]|nr:PSD1 domain-containing protein [Planctomycetaceae bacterium]
MQKCAECHTGDTPEGDLRVDNLNSLKKGGMGGPAILPENPDAGLLLERVLTEDADLQMPPEERLTEQEIADLKKWIADGATWPESNAAWATATDRASHWAFQPVRRVDVPEVANSDWCRTPIDFFVSAGHAARGVTPVDQADRRTLIRRATFDLIGLPPAIEDVDAFVADESPDAFAKVIDRLLASPAYGERWGRHWLDQARYADTSGDGTDTPIPEARYYRDYVIRSFNDDLPYNQFLKEQIAGDLMAADNPDSPRANDQIIATGYIALSRRFGNSAFAEMNLIIDDTIDTIGKSVLGLTLGCCRCHHHKFDPVTLNDYYGLHGYFNNTQYPHAGTEHQKDRQYFVSLTKTKQWPADYESLEAWAVSDKEKLSGDSRILLGGDPGQKGDVAKRGFLSVLSKDLPEIPSGSSGRLQFAEWLASDSNPLTTRVIVNRVWQYHFGKGIVESSSNFGLQGSQPSHPELLDWLATFLTENNWSLKKLHKEVMTSSVYQLSSTGGTENAKADEANVSLWKFSRRRMDAETIRDSLLSVSRLLEGGSGGRHPFKATKDLKYSQGRPFMETFDHRHRSVYLMTTRLQKHPFLALFDGPDPNKTTDNRRESTVALQALYMMNSPFINETAEAFANRLKEFSSDDAQRIQHGFRLTVSRLPTDEELKDCLTFLNDYRQELVEGKQPEPEADKLAWIAVARVILSSSEFLYID